MNTKNRIPVMAVAITALLLGLFNEAKATVTVLSVGGPGWIGQNLERLIGPDTGYTIITTSFTGTKNQVSITLDNPANNTPWRAQFRGTDGADLGIGTYYTVIKYGAVPVMIAGLNVSGGGHGNLTVSGYFQVREITWIGNFLNSLAADGYQITDGDPADYAKFSFRYNSDMPLTSLSSIVAVPEPCIFALLPLVGMLALRRCRK